MAGLLGVLGLSGTAGAWVYPEHRDIALIAVQHLDADRRAEFEALWGDARADDATHLCPAGVHPDPGAVPTCLDWADLAPLAGDHSCSSAELDSTVRSTDWMLRVAEVGARLKADLAQIPVVAKPETLRAGGLVQDLQRRMADASDRARRVNAMRASNSRLQRADPKMLTRAAANNAHFLLARPNTEIDPVAYAELALQPGDELNALGVYSWFHVSAVQKASRLARESLSPEDRRRLARAALFDEGFALHFLEDSYAAGHVAGTWGDSAQRMGTHDYYNENGLEAETWERRDRSVVLMGDAHMRPQDAETAAAAVRTSLEQVLDAAAGRPRAYELPETPAAPAMADPFDVCAGVVFPERDASVAVLGRYRELLREALLPTPVPGLGPGLGSQPRYRSEVGGFLGLAASIDGRLLNGGFEPSQTDGGYITGLDLSARAGLGLEGALGDSGDGLIFLQVGYRADGPSSNKFQENLGSTVTGSLTAAIPARSAWSVRLRMPYYVVPFDLLLLSPMYFFARDAYSSMAVTASNGGLIPWQAGMETGPGRFQFVLGRELGVTWYGLNGDSQVPVPSDPPGGVTRLVTYRSTYFDVPVLEYRPFRAYADRQSSTLQFQLFVGADVPRRAEVAYPPGAPTPKLDTIWSVGLRMAFDWRRYW